MLEWAKEMEREFFGLVDFKVLDGGCSNEHSKDDIV
jgi:hypothetical protein